MTVLNHSAASKDLDYGGTCIVKQISELQVDYHVIHLSRFYQHGENKAAAVRKAKGQTQKSKHMLCV